MIRIGIIGAGATVAIADAHVEGFLADGRCAVTAVYSRTQASARRLAAAHGLREQVVCGSADAVYDRADAVVVCTPNDTHLSYLGAAAERGKAVLLEKPLGLEFAAPGQEERLLTRCEGKPVMVGYVCRHSALMRRVRALVKERMGRVYCFEAEHGGARLADPRLPLEWRMRQEASGSGALGDFGSHLLDLAGFTAGVHLVRAAGFGATFLRERPADGAGRTRVENDDAFLFCGQGEKGEVCSFSTSRVGMDGAHLKISGEGGLIRAHLNSGKMWFWPKERAGAYAPQEQAVREDYASDGPAQWFSRQASAFLDLIEGRPGEGCCTLAQAVRTERTLLELAQAAAEKPLAHG